MNLNWDDVRYFLAVYRNASFVAAASELKVTHTTVARRITGMEEALQTQLFHRTEQGCRLTREGEALAPYAERMESTIISMEGALFGTDRQLTGSVRVGAPDGIGNTLLATCLGEFQINNPLLEVELIAAPMYHSLTKREIDILITVQRPTAGHIVTRKITDYTFGLFSSRKYLEGHTEITSEKDLKDHYFISYIDDLLFDNELRFLEDFNPALQTRFKSSTVIGQARAVASGAGIGVIPYFIARQEQGLIHILPEIRFDRSFWLQVNPDTRQLARVRAAIDHISARMEELHDDFLSPPVSSQDSSW